MAVDLTLADLRRWEDGGATWRLLELHGDHVTVELCSCTGEPMELALGRQPELIEYVRRAGGRGEPEPPDSGVESSSPI